MLNIETTQFERDGYLVLEDVLDPEGDLAPLRAEYAALLDDVICGAVARGTLADDYAGLPFEARFAAALTHTTENLYRHFDIALPNEPIHEHSPIHLGPAVYNMIHSERLLDVVASLIGGEITANPIQHARLKPPTRQQSKAAQGTLVGQTGWHQDQGVFRPEADDTEMLTVWIAITDATIENGCLQVVPGSHRSGLADHCPLDVAVEIPAARLSGEPTPVPIRAGSALVMHRLTQHASLPNVSDGIRWSFDLRYQPTGQPSGRDELPGMVVRSESGAHALTSYAEWLAAWDAARLALAAQGSSRGKVHRWDGDSPACA